MPFIPHTETDIREMLDAIGAESIDELFDEIPESLRIEGLDGVPSALNEMQVTRLMHERAAQDREDRLRKQLRANLQRRKAQARSRGTSKQQDRGQ